jgi:hypothetical protein
MRALGERMSLQRIKPRIASSAALIQFSLGWFSKRYFSFPALASRCADHFLEPFVVWANRWEKISLTPLLLVSKLTTPMKGSTRLRLPFFSGSCPGVGGRWLFCSSEKSSFRKYSRTPFNSFMTWPIYFLNYLFACSLWISLRPGRGKNSQASKSYH